jgi:hypothetical protein
VATWTVSDPSVALTPSADGTTCHLLASKAITVTVTAVLAGLTATQEYVLAAGVPVTLQIVTAVASS